MTERRQHARRRTYLAGRIEVAKLAGWELACTVRNLSETGARLAFPADVLVPQHVSVAVSNGPRRPAQLIWFREGHAGFALHERRGDPRPRPANDTASTKADAARLASRIAAISAKTGEASVGGSGFAG